MQCTLHATALWGENHSQQIQCYFTLQTPSFSLDSVRTVKLCFGSTPPSLYVNGCFATDFSGAAICVFFEVMAQR